MLWNSKKKKDDSSVAFPKLTICRLDDKLKLNNRMFKVYVLLNIELFKLELSWENCQVTQNIFAENHTIFKLLDIVISCKPTLAGEVLMDLWELIWDVLCVDMKIWLLKELKRMKCHG